VPYAWLFAAQASANFDTSNVVKEITVVEGFRASGASFVTKSPQLPFMILRDPPGDGSQSSLLNAGTTCNTTTLGVKASSSSTTFASVKRGSAFSVGLGGAIGLGAEVNWSVETGFATWISNASEFEIGGESLSQTEKSVCVTSLTEYQTNAADDVVGRDADLFIGAAYVIAYAVADEIGYNEDSCKLVKSRTLAMANDSLATRYVFSRFQIENQELPKLDSLIAHTPLEPDGSLSQAAKDYTNQKGVWLQALAESDNLKAQGLGGPVSNTTFDGVAGPITQSTTFESMGSVSFSYELFLESSVAFEAGFEAGGSGLLGGWEFQSSAATNEQTTSSTTTSTTISYVLDDDDAGDAFSVTIGTDPVYGTPVFGLVGGQSSCPPEEGTTIRDDASMVVIGLSAQTVPLPYPSPPVADFSLDISNLSLSLTDPNRDYLVDLIQNTEGAIVRVDGSDIGTGSATISNVPQGGTYSTTLTIEKGSTALEYNDILVGLFPLDCPDEPLAEVSVDVVFESSCVDATLLTSESPWSVTAIDENKLLIQLTDYGVGDLNTVTFQYRRFPAGTWTAIPGSLVDAATLAGSGAIYDYLWDVSSLFDGDYQIRARVNCSAGITYTDVLNGTIDRNSLQPISTVPLPGGTLVFGQVPSVTFNPNRAIENQKSLERLIIATLGVWT